MSILQVVQESACDSNIEITDLLRKFKILAVKLKHLPLQAWIDHELNGYPTDSDLPSYRALQADCYGDFYAAWVNAPANPIPLSIFPKEHQGNFGEVKFQESIAYFVDFIKSGQVAFMAGLPHELFPFIANKVLPGTKCVRAYRHVPRGSIVAIVDSVRTRILNFALEIEQENPEFEDSNRQSWQVDPQKVNYLFMNCIWNEGTLIVGNVTSGNDFTGRDKIE